jgi:O-antigen ligase
LTVLQLTLRLAGIEIPEDSGTSLLLTEPSNYTALFVLFGLVVTPLIAEEFSNRPKVVVVLGALGLFGIWFNDSRSMLLVGVALCAIRLAELRPAITAAASAVGVAAVVTSPIVLNDLLYDSNSVFSIGNFQTNFSNLERLGLIVHSVYYFADHPFGGGIGSSSDIYASSPYTIGSYPTAHNTLAMLMVELGWLGVVFYLALVILLVALGVRFFRRRNPAVVLAAALFPVTVLDAVFFNGAISIVFWTFLGFLVAEIQQRSDRHVFVFERESAPCAV